MSTYLAELPFVPADWVSQAEAARLRGVTRQAIARLIKRGRLQAQEVGGHLLVRRDEVLAFTPQEPGRPKERRNPPGE